MEYNIGEESIDNKIYDSEDDAYDGKNTNSTVSLSIILMVFVFFYRFLHAYHYSIWTKLAFRSIIYGFIQMGARWE